MTTKEIIKELAKMRKDEPKRFYAALGFDDDGIDILNSFFGSSYEVGIVAGALWMQERMRKEMKSLLDDRFDNED